MVEITKKQFLALDNVKKVKVLKEIISGKIKYKGGKNGGE